MPFSPGQDSTEAVWFSDVSETPWWETLQLRYSSLIQAPEDRSSADGVLRRMKSIVFKWRRVPLPVRQRQADLSGCLLCLLESRGQNFLLLRAHVLQSTNKSTLFFPLPWAELKKKKRTISDRPSACVSESQLPGHCRPSVALLRQWNDPQALVTCQNKAPFLSGSMLVSVLEPK